MRWYKIVLGNGMVWDATGDPNALNVEIDIPVQSVGLAGGGAFVRIWGIDRQLLLNANQLLNTDIQVYGGMQQPGLPLADPSQQGLLAQAKVFPAFGNWNGTDMTLDLIMNKPFGGTTTPGANNVIHSFQQGQPLSTSIQQTLALAAPGYTPIINISPALVLNYTDTGFYQNMAQWSDFITGLSKSILNIPGYIGVHMHVDGMNIIVGDGTSPTAAPIINFQDLVGQPIWTGVNTIQFKTVMRGDIKPQSTVTLPTTLGSISAASGAEAGQASASNTIQGSFMVTSERHVGNFRQPDWASWVTVFDAIQNNGGSSSPSASTPSTIGSSSQTSAQIQAATASTGSSPPAGPVQGPQF